MLIHIVILFIIVLEKFQSSLSYEDRINDRTKRHLIFPEIGNDLIQFIIGAGFPVQELIDQSITFGFVLKMNYKIPNNASYYTQHFLYKEKYYNVDSARKEDNNNGIVSKSFRTNSKITKNTKSDKKNEEIILDQEVLNSTKKSEENQERNWKSRWDFYSIIIQILNRAGHIGRVCLLKAICETAQTPFEETLGFYEELFQKVLTPSITKDKLNHYTDNEYLAAERMGKANEDCEFIFKECKFPFSKLYSKYVPDKFYQ